MRLNHFPAFLFTCLILIAMCTCISPLHLIYRALVDFLVKSIIIFARVGSSFHTIYTTYVPRGRLYITICSRRGILINEIFLIYSSLYFHHNLYLLCTELSVVAQHLNSSSNSIKKSLILSSNMETLVKIISKCNKIRRKVKSILFYLLMDEI